MIRLNFQMAALSCLAMGLSAHAQSIATYQATVNGSNMESGKCTIEVVVDAIAEVEVRGTQGRIRTLTGQPSQWRRFQCDGTMPLNMSDFRFKGIDGRGRVELIQDPRNNRGVAVVRIEDNKGGSEGYTFDLEWRGGSGNAGGSWGGGNSGNGWGNGGNGSGWGNGGGNGSGWGGGKGGGGRARINDSIRACQDALRADSQQQGYTNVRFRTTNTDNNAGRRDRITGTLDARGRNNRTDTFTYSCDADFSNGTAGNANVRRQ